MTITYKWSKKPGGDSTGHHDNIILKQESGHTGHTIIPADPMNSDYQEYLEWAKSNSTPNE